MGIKQAWETQESVNEVGGHHCSHWHRYGTEGKRLCMFKKGKNAYGKGRQYCLNTVAYRYVESEQKKRASKEDGQAVDTDTKGNT